MASVKPTVVKNDPKKVRENIQMLHALAATLTRQPAFILAPEEADNLATAVVQVADHHQVDLFATGGQYALYLNLAMVAFSIYFPRFMIVKGGGKIVGVAPAAPTSPGEAATVPAGMMDFSSDVG